MSASISGMSGSMGSSGAAGGPGQAKSIIEATLSEVQQMQALARAPLKIPDARIAFATGNEIDLSI